MHNRIGHRFQRRLDVPVWLERGPQGLAYSEKVLALGPIRYWPLWDPIGAANAEELVVGDNAALVGAPVFGEDGIGDGNTSIQGDGANDAIDIYSVNFDAVFDGKEGTWAGWFRVTDDTTWTGGAFDTILEVRVDGANEVALFRDGVARRLTYHYEAGGVVKEVDVSGLTSLDFIHAAITWSAIADEAIMYMDGLQVGAIQNGLGVWAGALSPARNVILATSNVPAQEFAGYAAHHPFFDYPLSGAEILDLATV